jgi:16S rRNA (guanine527-N7)-methyltransferase
MTVQHRATDLLRILREGSGSLGVSLGEEVYESMLRHLQLVEKWRTRINLTAISDPVDMVVRHCLDSLTVFKVLPWDSGFRLIDVGTGGGFPGVVLRLADGSLRLTLLDRDPRKIVFLKHLVRELGLSKVAFLNVPLAHLLTATEPGKWDAVVTRAFSSDRQVLDSLHTLVRAGGILVRMEGPRKSEPEGDLTCWRVEAVWEGTLPFSNVFRRVTRYARR